MRYLSLFALISCSLISSCTSNYRDTALYSRDGRAKPIVAIMPVINSMEQDVAELIPWDVSQEITEQIRHRISDNSRLYLLRDQGDAFMAKQLNDCEPAALSRFRLEEGGAAEFVVVTELVGHREVANSPTHFQGIHAHPGEAALTVEIDFRIRVLDVRKERPEVILQELLHHKHLVPRPYLNCDYAKASWQSEAFERTPMGVAHSRLAREVVSRIESYIQAVR